MKTIRINKDNKEWLGMHSCRRCKNETISEKDNFCGRCGSKIRWVGKGKTE